MLRQLNKRLISILTWEFHALVEKCSDDFGSLTLWEVDVHRQDLFGEINELFKKRKLSENSSKFVSSLLLCFDRVIVNIIFSWELGCDNSLVQRNSVCRLLIVLKILGLL